jgi:hypothetical protein
MAVPTKFGAVRNTTGSTFTSQTVGGVVMGIESTAGPLTKSFSILDAITLNHGLNADALPRLKASGIYTTKKALEAGTFAYNAARAGTWVISRITTSLSGVANTRMLFMASNSARSIASFKHDIGVKMLTAWRTQRFAWTGKLANGNPVNSRTLWLNGDGTAVAKPATLGTTFMFDLRDGNATDVAVDDAANPTRAIPGEFVLRADLVGAGLSSGNHFTYKPITGM